MKKFAVCLLAATLLAGCGVSPMPSAPVSGATSLKAQGKSWSPQGLATQLARVSDAIFRKWDRDADGEVELGQEASYDGYFEYGGGTVRVTWREIDANRNGEVTPEELKAFYTSTRTVRAMQIDLYKMFERFDADESGGLTSKEFSLGLEKVYDKLASKYMLPTDFESGDIDRNGGLTPSEFEDLYLKSYADLS